MMARFFIILLSLIAACGSSAAATHIVAFGGGDSPRDDQVSLLKNVIYFNRVRQLLKIDHAPYEVYFADGGKNNVVQMELADDDRQRLIDVLGNLLYGNDETRMRYKPVTLPNVAGPATRDNLEKWFDRAGKSIAPMDRLIFYFTGHGGPDNGNHISPRNTTFYLWNNGPGYSMNQFETQLDKLDPKVETTLIMVQCFSGGFANVIYKQGDPKNGFSDHLRAGFFSTIASRMAAGCTPDINEEDYHDFSTSFFEALCGESRTGKTITKPDFDHDGKVSFTEALYYAILNSPTIDIPTCTSDRLLRDKSRYNQDHDHVEGLLPANAPWPQVLAAASTEQRIVLEQLSGQLKLGGEDRLSAASKSADDLFKQFSPPRPRRQNASTLPTTFPNRFVSDPDFQARQRLRRSLVSRWPELAVPFNPDALATIDANWKEIESFLQSQADYKTVTASWDRERTDDDSRENAELRWVKYERFIEFARTVILASNLPKVADAQTMTAYQTLIRLENETLSDP